MRYLWHVLFYDILQKQKKKNLEEKNFQFLFEMET